ncbi:MAG TPA: hypothetical protein VIF62_30030 [Labilithrix sp.]|jgi:HEAT repeat protein
MAEVDDRLRELFDAEKRARTLHDEILRASDDVVTAALEKAATRALAQKDHDAAAHELVPIARLLGEVEGPKAVDLLIDLIASGSAEARVVAGEMLEAVAFDRFKEVALGIERALARLPKGSAALTELPFLLAEVGEPGCVKLLGMFLKLPDADAVAAAIEALAELGDPAAVPLLAPLEKDARQVQLDDEDHASERVSIGDLAYEARELLEEVARAAQGETKDKKKGR